MGYSNLAHNLEQENDELQKKIILREKRKLQKKKNMESLRKHAKVMFCAVIVAASAALMISRGVEVHETELEISKLQKQLAAAESVTCQKTFNLENSIDLKTVEDVATNKLGMKRPEKYQTIYINVEKNDSTEITAKEVEGVSKKSKDAFHAFCENLVGIFSIH